MTILKMEKWKAELAQSVERAALNRVVGGSIPSFRVFSCCVFFFQNSIVSALTSSNDIKKQHLATLSNAWTEIGRKEGSTFSVDDCENGNKSEEESVEDKKKESTNVFEEANHGTEEIL